MFCCMRTTIRIDDNLLTQVKKKAAESHTTITAVIEKALREMFKAKARPSKKKVSLRTYKGRGLQHDGIDLDDNAGLLDFMEDRA